jgi:D-serine deaminase-like pyridoxal phosphate-dependent protein
MIGCRNIALDRLGASEIIHRLKLTKDSLNNNFPKFTFFIVPTQSARRYTQVLQAQALEFKACFERDRGAIQSKLWTPAGPRRSDVYNDERRAREPFAEVISDKILTAASTGASMQQFLLATHQYPPAAEWS